MLDTLHDPIFTTKAFAGPQREGLAAILARLAGGHKISFPEVRAHHLPAWHCFLVQLGALAIDRAGRALLTEECWHDALVALTHGDPEAWHLVRKDWQAPAFFQHGSPARKTGFKALDGPHKLDLISGSTGRAHDEKPRNIDSAEQWAYIIIARQTWGGYSGPGLYGTARAGAAFGTRLLCRRVVEPADFQDCWVQDVHLSLDSREWQAAQGLTGDIRLAWAGAWDGRTSIPISACAPSFIEACQRIRLAQEDDSLVCYRASSKGQHIDAGDRPFFGDIWTPVDDDGNPVHLWGEGWTAKKQQAALLSLGAPLAVTAGDGNAFEAFGFSGEPRKSKTLGFHHFLHEAPDGWLDALHQAVMREESMPD